MTQLKAKQVDKNEAWKQSGSVAKGDPGGQGRPVLLYNITVAAGAQEGLEELSHVEGQEGWR